MTRRRASLIAFAVGTLLVLMPAAAQAHGMNRSAPGGGGNGGVGTFHDSAYACDTSADGQGIRTRYRTSNNVEDYVGDANGNSPGCGSEAAVGGGTITTFWVCKGSGSSEVCTGPVTVS